MEKTGLILGFALMILGVGLVIAAVFLTLGRLGTFGRYGLALTAAGCVLVVLGRWLIQ